MKNLYRSVLLAMLIASFNRAQSQVPVMSSLPSASSVIFLDFDGHTVANTSWNYAGPIYCGASGLNNTQIASVFNRVAEDYRPFNVNITTDSTKYFAAPANSRMRVIITVSHEWYGSAGGVAFIGSFTWGDNTPCFVFSHLLNYNVKNISEAASHEAGHTLGLYHQARYDANCVKISDYHTGEGSGEIGWAPIMGIGYYRNFTLWNNGPNPYGCTNFQNDLAVITGSNGFTFRADDHGNAFHQATNVTFSNNQFIVNGIITQNTDEDMFQFTQPSTGQFTLNAIPFNVGTGNQGSNLDMQVTLYNSSQTLLNIYNPSTLLNSIIDTVLNPGTYYLKVEGRGNIYAPNYASLGSYSLQGNYSSGTLPLRRLELQGSVVNDRHRFHWIIDADEKVVEQVLEMSTNGRNFISLTHPAIAERNFVYSPNVTNTIQYRLKVSFDDGRTYYSNIVTLRNTDNDTRPKLLNNPVSNTILITSPGNFNYSIFDISGKLVAKGQLVSGMNMVSAAPATPGLYVIHFTDNSHQWIEKFVRQ